MSLTSRTAVWMLAGALTGAGPLAAEEPADVVTGLGMLGGSRLGVTLEELAPGDSPRGARVTDVEKGSPAEEAGLEKGDVIVAFDGESVRSTRQLARLVRETPARRSVSIDVVRAGKRQTLTAKLSAGPGFRVFRGPNGPGHRFEWRLPGDSGDLEDAPRLWAGPNAPALPFPLGRPRLGIRYQELGDQLAKYFGVSAGAVLVVRVEPDSPADRGGLEAGDVVTRVGDRAVEDGGDLQRAVREAGDGETLRVTVNRRGATRELEIALEDREQPAGPAEAI